MERNKLLTILLSIAVLLGLGPPVFAQRGMGDTDGVVRQGLKLDTVTMQGDVVRVITGPCEKSTGWSEIGTHFILKTEQGEERNIHLGPAQLVQGVADMLSTGSNVTARVFRTEKMPKGNYNAVAITVDNKTMRLREPNLRPVWAGQTRSGRRYQSNINWMKRRDGRGVRSPGQLSGSDLCLRPQPYCRRGYSSGRMGRGRGQGRGQGRGRGRGQGWGRRWQSSQSRFGFGMRRRSWR